MRLTRNAIVCGLALCLFAASGTQERAKVEKPAFLVSYCHEVTDPYQSLELAVWKSGRVIWRVGKTGGSPKNSRVWLKGKYYEGQIAAERVRAALHEFRAKNLLNEIDLATCIWPTPSPRRIEITDGANHSCFALEKSKYTWQVSRRAQTAWARVKRSLIPEAERLIPAPRVGV